MLFLYVILGVTLTIVFIMLYCLIVFDKVYLEARMSLREFDILKMLVRRELNLSDAKKWGLSDIIEKCDTVNNIWSETSGRKDVDVSTWAFVFALHYLNQKQFRGLKVKKVLLKQKWKYRHKYLFLYYLNR